MHCTHSLDREEFCLTRTRPARTIDSTMFSPLASTRGETRQNDGAHRFGQRKPIENALDSASCAHRARGTPSRAHDSTTPACSPARTTPHSPPACAEGTLELPTPMPTKTIHTAILTNTCNASHACPSTHYRYISNN